MNDGPQLISSSSLKGILEALAADDNARCLSGGATLVAMLNTNLIEPSSLIPLKSLTELAGIKQNGDGSIKVGAMTRHIETATSELLVGSLSGVRNAASKIANPIVRNMGTMGGSISFSDPAADYPPALIAAEAEIEVISIKGTRRVAAEEFFIDWYETALQSGEIVSAIHLPKADLNACGYHEKFARVEGDFATASVNVVLTMHANKCSLIRIAVGACGPTPIRSHEAEKFLTEHDLNEKNIFKAGELLAKNCDPIDDARASAAYRLKLVPQLLIRAIQNAKHNLKEADLA